MKSTVTVRLDDDLDRELTEVSEALGRSRSDLVREALRRQLSVLRFDELREQVMPFAEARGYLTDEDVFEEVSCACEATWDVVMDRETAYNLPLAR